MSTDAPRYGQRAFRQDAPDCSRHPGRVSVGYCKRCNRPMCIDCAIPTEVGYICVDCAGQLQPRRYSKPVITQGLIVACVVMFGLDWVIPWVQRTLLFAPFLGKDQPWRFVTAAFLHAGIMHLVFNMLALYWLGRTIEPLIGRWRFLSLYVLSALGGSVAVLGWAFVDPSAWATGTVGASGAVFGLFAAIFVMQKLSGSNTTAVLVLLGINLVYGFITPGVSWQAHVGGLITGGVVTYLYAHLARPKPGRTARVQESWAVLATVGVAAVLVAVIGACYAAVPI